MEGLFHSTAPGQSAKEQLLFLKDSPNAFPAEPAQGLNGVERSLGMCVVEVGAVW